MTSLLSSLDAQLDTLFTGWNIYSTTLLVLILAVTLSPLFLTTEPDLHPFLLARQSAPSPVRASGESSVLRSIDIPHGYPLRSGLAIKDAGTSKWGPGRDGDLRDIWRAAVQKASGKVLGLKGRDSPVVTELAELQRQIVALGRAVSVREVRRCIVWLPDCVELVGSLFAAAFYGFTPILVPSSVSLGELAEIVRQTGADSIIASAGVISADDLQSVVPDAKIVVLVVQSTSQHLDFAEDGKSSGNGKIVQWHSIVSQGQAGDELPASGGEVPNILSVWQAENEPVQVVEYTQANVVSAVAAQLSVLPRNHSFTEKDTIVSLVSLTQSFPLTIILTGLYSGASIALTSVAGTSPDYNLALQGNLKPTIVIASSATIAKSHAQQIKANQGFFQKLHQSRHAGYLAAGTMRVVNQQSPRLIYIPDGPNSTPLSPQDLNDVRIFNGSRIIHALAIPQVFGAVAQTSLLDYRIDPQSTTKRAHFGAVLSSVEIKLVESKTKISDEDYQPVGQLVVNGPAVVGKGAVSTGIEARFNDDQTLQLV